MPDLAVQHQLDAIVRARIQKQQGQIAHSLRQIAAGNPLGAETDGARRVARLALKTGFDVRQAEALSTSIEQTSAEVGRTSRARPARAPKAAPRLARALVATGPEAVWGTPDFVGVQFFARGGEQRTPLDGSSFAVDERREPAFSSLQGCSSRTVM